MKNNNDMHPEDLIYKVRVFIKELAKVQEERFDALVKTLGLNEKGEEWLWDYIFNSDEDTKESFEEYLDNYNVSYGNLTGEDISKEDFYSNSGWKSDDVTQQFLKEILSETDGWKYFCDGWAR